MRKIVLVSGFSGSGKDTFADFLANGFGFKKMAFADKLKRHTAVKYGFDPMLTLTQSGKRQVIHINGIDLSVRDCLIYESKKFKSLCGENIFAKHITDRINELNDINDNTDIVISDFRFPNEYHWLRGELDTNIVTVRINRYEKSPINSDTENQLNDFSFDYVINNDGDLHNYISKIALIVNKMFGKN